MRTVFLMVEGSQVDWAAHANDPVGIITEFLAFDEAVGKVMDFARSNGETAVIVLADHGNSGFTIGTSRCTRVRQVIACRTVFDRFAMQAHRIGDRGRIGKYTAGKSERRIQEIHGHRFDGRGG